MRGMQLLRALAATAPFEVGVYSLVLMG